MGVLAQAMTTAARTFLESLAAGQRAAAVGTLEPGEHTSWTYLPGPRPGVRVGDLTNEQCDLASALVSCSYGLLGAAKADRVVAVEAAALGLPSADPTGACSAATSTRTTGCGSSVSPDQRHRGRGGSAGTTWWLRQRCTMS